MWLWRAAYTAPGLDDELLLEEPGLGLLVLVVLAVPALQWLYHSYRFGAIATHSYLAGTVVAVHSPLGDAKLLHFGSELRASSHSHLIMGSGEEGMDTTSFERRMMPPNFKNF